MKKVVVIVLMSLGFIGCLPADEKIIECEPIVLEGMYYHYDSNSGEVTYMKNQVNYLFADGEVTVRDANFLILKGTYHIQDGVLTVTSNIKNIVYEPYDVIEIKISISKDGKSFNIPNTWTWFITSSEVRGDYKFIYK
jgi:hypothetical protein